jgi:hypothetical protein
MAIHGPASSPLRLPDLRPSRPATGAAPAPRDPEAPAITAASGEPASLWGLLTEDERAFFQQQAALGSLTYGRPSAAAPAAGAPTGQRLDVRA